MPKPFLLKCTVLSKQQKIAVAIVAVYCFYLLLPLNGALFNDPYSSVILDCNKKLLSAQIAKDGQWRFPYSEAVPYKFQKAIVAFEDKRFYSHWGIDLLAATRALFLNVKHGRVVSGGSTIHMQVIRLSRKGRRRTVTEKLSEAFFAHHLFVRCSRSSVLALYASNAPFGGNVVGLHAAAWRYFGKSPAELSWAESCMLAVLPNSPSLVHLSKNRVALKEKRNKLLHRLYMQGDLPSDDYMLALEEDLPNAPKPFPMYAPHLLEKLKTSNGKGLMPTSIYRDFQKKSLDVLLRNYEKLLKPRNIHNAAVVIIDVQTKQVVAYHANIPHFKSIYAYYVNCAEASRSTGSVLKPFLYASMLSQGMLLPYSIVPDVPVNIGGYAPENYSRGYAGAVTAGTALARSLNVPAVLMLRDFGVQKFYDKLKRLGMTTLKMPADHYGLSLILGGCEGSLLEITNAYAGMARSLANYDLRNGMYSRSDYDKPLFVADAGTVADGSDEYSVLSASSIWFTFKAMLNVDRPDTDGYWREFASSEKIAWKTGTSFGFRDAWAVGVTPRYAVGVWVGNATGEGMPEIIGLRVAAPMLFEMFSFLPYDGFFQEPEDDLVALDVCRRSGMLASPFCCSEKQKMPKQGNRSMPCLYHKRIHLNAEGNARVNADCYAAGDLVDSNWFVLPPSMEHYYKQHNASYVPMPKFLKGCEMYFHGYSPMEIVYPLVYAKIYIPVGFGSKKESTVFHIVHADKNAVLYWHVDDLFVGQTSIEHKMPINVHKGKHTLTVVDSDGHTLSRLFEIVSE